MDDASYRLILAQLEHFRTKMGTRLENLESNAQHQSALEQEKLEHQKTRIKTLETESDDFEKRIRELNNLVLTMKTTQTQGATLLTALIIIASSIAAWLGTR